MGYFSEVNVQYRQEVHEVHNDLLFLPERVKVGKTEKLVANLYDRKEYFVLTKEVQSKH